jgi:8-hydroxy-5-deazaflavin:NADPH oxidoreductase
MVLAVIGGTGAQGMGLAYRFARAGRAVVIGSRSAERAVVAADEICERLDGRARIRGDSNAAAAAAGSVVVLAVPYAGQAELAAELAGALAGKVVVSCCNPLGFDKKGAFALPVGAGSAAEELREIVPTARVVGAFHHLSASTLSDDQAVLADEDVLVVGDDEPANNAVVGLCRDIIGRDGIHAGPLRVARHVEQLTAALISINKRDRVRAGLRISGLAGSGADRDVRVA